MWAYEKGLQFPANIAQTRPKTASLITSQFDGPDEELATPTRCLSQRYTIPYKEVGGPLTDIGTEGLAHLEMICAITYQLTEDLTAEQAKTAGSSACYIDHTTTLWSTAAAGISFNACEFQFKGDAITDLHENLAVEQRARTAHDNLTRVIENPEVRESLKFLRIRGVVHFQRSGGALEKMESKLGEKNFYYLNAESDKQSVREQQIP